MNRAVAEEDVDPKVAPRAKRRKPLSETTNLTIRVTRKSVKRAASKENVSTEPVSKRKRHQPLIDTTNHRHDKSSQHFRRITHNKAVAPVRIQRNNTSDADECDCRPTDERPCSPWSYCLNQHTHVECSSCCRAGDKCENQRFRKRIYRKLEVRKTYNDRGFGLFAAEHIESDAFLIEYVGEVINLTEFYRRFNRQEHMYCMSIGRSLFIDGGRMSNEARFLNHSCQPNSEPQRWCVSGVTRIGIFARARIRKVSFAHYNYLPTVNGVNDLLLVIYLFVFRKGQEITIDYDWCKIPGVDGMALTACSCGSKNCSGIIGVKCRELR